MDILRRPIWNYILYISACVLSICQWPTEGITFFVECYNCTANGWDECYGGPRKCPTEARAFYCFTVYNPEGLQEEKGCATDYQLSSWLLEPSMLPRRCTDTKDGRKVCYCRTHVPPCPAEPTVQYQPKRRNATHHLRRKIPNKYWPTSTPSPIQFGTDLLSDHRDSIMTLIGAEWVSHIDPVHSGSTSALADDAEEDGYEKNTQQIFSTGNVNEEDVQIPPAMPATYKPTYLVYSSSISSRISMQSQLLMIQPVLICFLIL